MRMHLTSDCAEWHAGAFAVLALRTWWRHVADSHPSALFQAANSSDLQKLQGLLNRAPRDTEGLSAVLFAQCMSVFLSVQQSFYGNCALRRPSCSAQSCS